MSAARPGGLRQVEFPIPNFDLRAAAAGGGLSDSSGFSLILGIKNDS